ncbi:MAG: glucosaminidase domain-containing protein [Flavobacteriales bacterium]|nr:glucosaminidase domain-containing protein [Flavobacteriales bacterium]
MRFLLSSILSFSVIMCFAQSSTEYTEDNYIAKYKEDAIREMHRSGVPASITLAQGILESAKGGSPLAKNAKNHFGIKCHTVWEGPTYYQDDDIADECFRKYSTVLDSYKDHSDFLRTRSRYDFLFELEAKDYKAWARGLKKAGYATDPKYPVRLIKIIEENSLYRFDNVEQVAEVKKKESQRSIHPLREEIITQVEEQIVDLK